MSDAAEMAHALREAVKHLGEGRPADAVPLFARLEIALGEAEDLEDFRARTLSLLAQALLESGRPDEARAKCHEAIRICRSLDDNEGLQEVRALDERIAASLDQARRAVLAKRAAEGLAERTTADIEQAAQGSLAIADALLKHAGALRTLGQDDQALHSAVRAVHHADLAGAIRERVLARITLAECDQSRATEALLTALNLADKASETTLIGLVARAAELSGVAIPLEPGPHALREKP